MINEPDHRISHYVEFKIPPLNAADRRTSYVVEIYA